MYKKSSGDRMGKNGDASAGPGASLRANSAYPILAGEQVMKRLGLPSARVISWFLSGLLGDLE